MKIECVCGRWHDVSPTALAVVVAAFIAGDMQVITNAGLKPVCIGEAFKNDNRVNQFLRRYPKHKVQFDGTNIERKPTCRDTAGEAEDTPNAKERNGEE